MEMKYTQIVQVVASHLLAKIFHFVFSAQSQSKRATFNKIGARRYGGRKVVQTIFLNKLVKVDLFDLDKLCKVSESL